MSFSVRTYRRFTMCCAQLISHDWLRGCTQSTYIILILLLAACFGRPSETHGAPPQRHCSFEEDQASCFYHESQPSKQNSKVIIFAHGVFSTLASTWGDLRTEKSWPALLRGDERFENFDIYLMNYPSACLSNGPNIHETAKRELAMLEDFGVFDRYTEIYFIAHSMDGLMVKSLLTNLNHPNEDDIAKLRRVKATVFLGTPSQGVRLASWGKWVCRNPQLRDMEPSSLNTYLSKLDDSWTVLMDDRTGPKYPRAFCSFETKDEYNVDLVVPREAATSHCDGLPQGLALNHSDLAVATSKYHDPYLWVMGKIDETRTGVKPQNTPELIKIDDIAIFAECEHKPIPKTIPLDRDLKGVAFFNKSPTVPSQGFQYIGIPGEPNVWMADRSGFGYVCQLTNYGTVTVSDVKMTLGLRFKEIVKQGPSSYSPGITIFSDAWLFSITKIDPGASERFVFYMKNMTEEFLEVSMPEFIELRHLRESQQRKVPLFHHGNERVVQFMFPWIWPPRESPSSKLPN